MMSPERADTAPLDLHGGSQAREMLEVLQVHDVVAALEERVSSIEIDLSRLTGSRDDDARRIAGEMAVMRARVEDALVAFASTEKEVRAQVHTLLGPNDAVVTDVVDGVGDAMVSLAQSFSARCDLLAKEIGEARVVIERIASIVGRLTETPV